ncbi:MAG TPA: beta-ketoacyl-[acyl-carrier-protein] synthase family protein [Syntrophales bacterium]|nr:beta-ketoacyl-[acyl-carrier-protein] synthase family protein [Syntrophales bacterium]
MKRRVVITSMGIISSLGHEPGEILTNFKEEKVNFERPGFDSEVVISPVKRFNIRDYTGPFKDARYLNRGSQLALAAAIAAVKDSKLSKSDLTRAGLFIGAGPNLDIGGEFPEISKGQMNRRDLQALWILKFLPNTAASVIAKFFGIHGENLTVCTACSASLQAIGEAFRKIRNGYLDHALAGGGDSRLSPGGILAYKKANALYKGDGEPDKASRPFDCGRGGFVPGEGAAFFLLEEMEKAKERGVKILAEICGYGSSMDASSMTAPEGTGKWGKEAVLFALEEAEMTSSQIDVISAHGTGTLLNDDGEANLIHELYHASYPRIIALKSWLGHAASACGAIELAVSLVCMRVGYIPEIRNLSDPCHKKLNFVREAENCSFNTCVVENFGFGGQNAALVVR